MNGRELKDLWKSGTPSFGAWVTLSDPVVAKVMCQSGFDWLIVDAEHMPYNPESLRNIISTIRGTGVVPIVRVTDNSPALIKQTLDWGAEGIMIPLLRTVDDARRAAAACRYPPQGVRGWNPRDATDYFTNTDHYRETINDRVIAMLQVEHIEAVNNLDGFLAAPGVDCILIGPADLSYSLGYPLQLDHPEVQLAIQTTIDKCNAAGIPVGIAPGGSPEGLAAWMQRGINFITIGFDFGWMREAGTSMLQRMRELTGGR